MIPMDQDRRQDWCPDYSSRCDRVETVDLRPGLSIVLSRYEAGRALRFRYVEPEDMFGIGFHLKGGSRFVVEGSRFETQPFEVWAGAAPQGASSTFKLPAHGFLTASLRFTPNALADLLQSHSRAAHRLIEIARLAPERVAFKRLSTLDQGAYQCVEAMFTTAYTGAARNLFLESCALSLLAAQLSTTPDRQNLTHDALSFGLRKKVIVAREYLDVHFADPPTIRSLARIAGTNEFSLKRGFKVAFGATIFGYVRQRRMELAMENLRAGRSVGDTARAAGYECPRSFAQAFRRYFGTLPSAMARQLRAETPDRHG